MSTKTVRVGDRWYPILRELDGVVFYLAFDVKGAVLHRCRTPIGGDQMAVETAGYLQPLRERNLITDEVQSRFREAVRDALGMTWDERDDAMLKELRRLKAQDDVLKANEARQRMLAMPLPDEYLTRLVQADR